MHIDLYFSIAEWLGVGAFAISGAMTAVSYKLDPFGVFFCAGVTALGGGTLRDILLGQTPPKMFTSYGYLLLAAVLSICVYLFARLFKDFYLKSQTVIEAYTNVFDAVGLGAFVVAGAAAAINAGHMNNPFLVVFISVTTCIGGGMIRDICCDAIPFVLRKHIYALAAMAGAILYYYIIYFTGNTVAAAIIGASTTVIIRLLATHFKWKLPKAL